MSNYSKSPKDSKDTKKAVSRGESGKITKYFNSRREHPEYSKTKSMRLAGYAHDNAQTVENTKQFRALWEEHQELCKSLDLSIEERIRAAQKTTGAGVKSSMLRLQSVIKRKGPKHDKNAIAAAKQVTEITGERMPTEVSATLSGDEELLAAILTKHTT